MGAKKNPYRTEAFLRLKNKWYEKLKASGFSDIETQEGKFLNSWHNFRFKKTSINKRMAAEDYYYWAGQMLLTHEFKNKTHRLIWELHAEGKSKRQIAILIKNEKPTYKRESIGNIINEIKQLRLKKCA